MPREGPSDQRLADRLYSSVVLVVRNAASLLVAQFSTTVVTTVLFVLVARYLGVEQLGVYALAMTAAEVAAVFLDFGLNYFTTREVARDSLWAPTLLVSASVLKTALVAVVVALVGQALPWLYESPALRQAIHLGVLAAVFRSFRDLFTAFVNGLERMSITASIMLIQAGVWLIAGVYILRAGGDALALLQVRLGVDMVFAILSLAALLWIGKIPLGRPELNSLFQLAKAVLPFGLFVSGAALYARADTVILSLIWDEMAVGVYEAGRRLIVVVEVVPALVSLALYPTLSRILADRTADARRLFAQANRYMVMLGLPVAITTILAGPELLAVIYTGEYLTSATVLQVLGFAIPIRYAAYLLGTALLAEDNSWMRARGTWLATGLNLSLNVALIPAFGSVGAAVVSVATSVFLASYYYRAAQLARAVDLRSIARPHLTASLAMAMVLIVSRAFVPLYPRIVLAGVIYVILVVLLRGITYADFQILKQLVYGQVSDVGSRNAETT